MLAALFLVIIKEGYEPRGKEGAEMVIQSNMSPSAIVEIWAETREVFYKHNIPLAIQTLESLVEKELLLPLLQELNSIVGSSSVTCIKGG